MALMTQNTAQSRGSRIYPRAGSAPWERAFRDFRRFKTLDRHLLNDMGFSPAEQERATIRDFFIRPAV